MFNVQVPLNSVSFGHVSICILRELYKRGRKVNLFSLQPQPDLSAYNIDPDFGTWISASLMGASRSYKRTLPTFKLWHLQSSEASIGNDQVLFTFHEVDSLTPTEVNIAKNQKLVLVSSRYSEEVFRKHGVENVQYCPLGFDTTHFKPKNIPAPDGAVVFSLFGKWEKRKHTEKVIRAWAKKYGNVKGFMLNLHVYNPHFAPEMNQQLISKALEGKPYHNMNYLGYLRTLAEFNDCLNAGNIVLDMSGGEGFSIPSFSALALGKHGVVHNCSSIKDWAAESGAVLIEPNGKEPVFDGHFFRQGLEFNQGNIFTFDEEQFLSGCDEAVANVAANKVNEKGRALAKNYTWSKTVDIIESVL